MVVVQKAEKCNVDLEMAAKVCKKVINEGRDCIHRMRKKEALCCR